MSEPNNGGDGKGAPDTKNTTTNQPGTDPKQTETGNKAQLTDEQIAQAFEDSRLWTHPRFKDLNERAKKAEKYEADEQKAKEAKLLEEKKYQELLAEKEKQIGELSGKVTNSLIDSQIQIEAQKAGVVDLDAALKLIDRSNISATDGVVKGVTEAVDKLVTDKPYLKGNSNQTLGSGANPADKNIGVTRFKHSQLLDPVFYREHEADIAKALKLGLIDNDL